MSEFPSSAVTTVFGIVRLSPEGRSGAMAVPPMMPDTGDSAGEAVLDHAAALAQDDAGALDLLLRPPPLIEILPRPGAALLAPEIAEDWSGAAYDSARLTALAAPGLDLVFDGGGDGFHLVADLAAFAAADTVLPFESIVDPLVELAPPAGDLQVPSLILDAPLHVDVAVDDAARIDLAAPDLRGPELSWLAAINDGGLHVGEAWAWSDAVGGYIFDHCV